MVITQAKVVGECWWPHCINLIIKITLRLFYCKFMDVWHEQQRSVGIIGWLDVHYYYWLNYTSQHLSAGETSPIPDSVGLSSVWGKKLILSLKIKRCVVGICELYDTIVLVLVFAPLLRCFLVKYTFSRYFRKCLVTPLSAEIISRFYPTTLLISSRNMP